MRLDPSIPAHMTRKRLDSAREKDGEILDWHVPPRMGMLSQDRKRKKPRRERGQDHVR